MGCLSHSHNRGTGPPPRPGIRLSTFRPLTFPLCGATPNQLSYASRGSFLLDNVEGKGLWVHNQLSRKISERLLGTEREMKVGPLGPSPFNCQAHSPSLSSPGPRQAEGASQRVHMGLCVCVCMHAGVHSRGWVRMGRWQPPGGLYFPDLTLVSNIWRTNRRWNQPGTHGVLLGAAQVCTGSSNLASWWGFCPPPCSGVSYLL